MSKILLEIIDYHEIEFSKIKKLINDIKELKNTIEDIKYLKLHVGEMIFTGSSGKINERGLMLKTVKINTLDGCGEVPDLLLNLAERKLLILEAKELELSKEFKTK